MKRLSILFVCMGNICRSPMAEGTFRQMVENAGVGETIFAKSAGTGHWHIGNSPDHRAQSSCLDRGRDISDLRARQIKTSDFSEFDMVVAMDRSNLKTLMDLSPKDHRDKLHIFLDFSDSIRSSDIPDPYYGTSDDFELALNMIESASEGLLKYCLSILNVKNNSY